MKARIAIVEDENDLACVLKDYAEAADMEVVLFNDGDIASQWFEQHKVDLAVLDLMLPGKDGLSLCRELQANQTQCAIIMATAKVDEVDRLLGLELGADDYICKPYSPREVIARIKAILRRIQTSAPEKAANNTNIKLNEQKLSALIHGKEVNFTTVEMALFSLLFNKGGHIFSRSYIMDQIYDDYRVVSDRTVDSHIKKLRKKLSDAAPELQLIHSIYGAGYKYEYQELSS